MSNSSKPNFGPSCPSGGSWYACGNGAQFVGCCRSNPCTNNGCPAGNLFPANFAASAYGTFPDANCNGAGASFFTCKSPSFLGCCKSNPCSQGSCPSSDLVAAYLPSNPVQANQYDPHPALSSSSSSSSTSSSTTLATSSTSKPSTTSSSPTSTASSIPQVVSSSAHSHNTAVAGGIAGGVAALLILIIFALWRWHRHLKHSRAEMHERRASRTANGRHARSIMVEAYDSNLDAGGDLKKERSSLLPYQDPPTSPPPLYPNSYPSSPMPRYTPNPTSQTTIHEAPSNEVYRPFSPHIPRIETSPTYQQDRFRSWAPSPEMHLEGLGLQQHQQRQQEGYVGGDGVSHVRAVSGGEVSELGVGSRGQEGV